MAREVASKLASEEPIRAALESLGPKAEQSLDALDPERRLALVGQFVRGLRNVGVREAQQIEQQLFTAVGVSPTGRRSVVIKDPISLIAVRNHVQQLATAVGISWSVGMQVQSAVSDVARFIAAHGGGQIAMEAEPSGRMVFRVRLAQRLGSIDVHAEGAMPTWLVGVAKMANALDVAYETNGTRIDFWIAIAESKVA